MTKDEAIEKVNHALEEVNLTKEDLFGDMSKKLKIKPFAKGYLLAYSCLSCTALLLYSLFMKIIFNIVVFPEFLLALLIYIGCMVTPAYFTLKYNDFYKKYSFKGMNKKRNLHNYVKYSTAILYPNDFYNEKIKKKISLDIYKKISPFFQKEELENILSHDLTYEDLGLKDYFLTSSDEHVIFEEAKNNKIRVHNENRLHNQNLKEDKNKKIYKQLAQSLKNEE